MFANEYLSQFSIPEEILQLHVSPLTPPLLLNSVPPGPVLPFFLNLSKTGVLCPPVLQGLLGHPKARVLN